MVRGPTFAEIQAPTPPHYFECGVKRIEAVQQVGLSLPSRRSGRSSRTIYQFDGASLGFDFGASNAMGQLPTYHWRLSGDFSVSFKCLALVAYKKQGWRYP
jgi:hypothetical protein